MRVRHSILVTLTMFLLTPTAAFAHDGDGSGPRHVLGEWASDPLALASLIAAGLVLVRGFPRQWRSRAPARIPVRPILFAAAMIALAVALVSPLHAASEDVLTAHMLQHLLLTLVVAPLLVLSKPVAAVMWALPRSGRTAVRAAMTASRVVWARPVLSGMPAAVALHVAAVAAWHAPPLYEAALAHGAVHLAEHATVLGTAVVFWATVLPLRPRDARRYPAAIAGIFVVALAMTGLGALMTLTPAAWYAAHGDTSPAWGLTPHEDQQLAGAIMWMPGGLAYAAAAAVLLSRCLSHLEATHARRPASVGD